jgi:hypothetical protein
MTKMQAENLPALGRLALELQPWTSSQPPCCGSATVR